MLLTLVVSWCPGNGYMIQRNSSGRDSHLTDSGIACGQNDMIDGSSHIYSEPTTEDPNAYLDPVRIRLDPDEEMYWQGGDMSIIEGSVADTDYLDDFGRRSSGNTAATTSADALSPGSINIDKYKIRPPPPTMPLPAVPNKISNQYQSRPGPVSAPLATVTEADHDVYRSDESLLRRKLLAMGENPDEYNDVDEAVAGSSICSSTSTLMNNLNKCSSDSGSLASRDANGLSAPNITKTPPPPQTPPGDMEGRVNRAMNPSLQRSLPLLCPMPSDGSTSDSNTRPVHGAVCASVGCDLDVVTCDGNSSVSRPRH
jgi:hypothetical protein